MTDVNNFMPHAGGPVKIGTAVRLGERLKQLRPGLIFLLLPCGCRPPASAPAPTMTETPAAVAEKAPPRAAEVPPDLYAASFDDLVDEASRRYSNGRDEIVRMATDLMRELRPKLDRPPSVKDLLIGAVSLMRNTHYPDRGKHDFGDFCSLYRVWRREGLTHQQVISKLDGLEKF